MPEAFQLLQDLAAALAKVLSELQALVGHAAVGKRKAYTAAERQSALTATELAWLSQSRQVCLLSNTA